MSPKRGQDREQRNGIALVYGEDLTDTAALRELIEALEPAWVGLVQARRSPPVEVKNAKVADLPHRSSRLSAALRVESEMRPVACVFAHEDCDAVEPADEELSDRIENALSGIGRPAYAVTPAWELEAWWFLWPEAVGGLNETWRAPDDYVGRNVGVIINAKEALQKALVPKGMSAAKKRKFRTYRTSDAPRVAKAVRDRGEIAAPRAKSQSFERFARRVAASVDALKT